MIVHLFNSSSVSGPERLVLPALARMPGTFRIVNLREERISRLRESDPLEDYARSLGLEYQAVRVRRRWDRTAIGETTQLLAQQQPELLHAHAMKASIYAAHAVTSRTPRLPLVSTHHGAHSFPDWKTRLYEWIYRMRYSRFFDRVLCVSADDYEFLLKSGIDKDRLRLHLNGIDAPRFDRATRPAESRRVRAQWIPQESGRDGLFLLGVIARLSAEKDHPRLFHVLARLNDLPVKPDWRCLIFGMGELESSLRQLSLQLGLQRRILWMGYRNGVGNELAGLDLLLSFSRMEGLPINLLEAGWAGTPVMTTWVGGIKELIPDDRSGVRVLPTEPTETTAQHLHALITGAGREKTLEALGIHLQERVIAGFTQERWLQRLLDIYSELNIKVSSH